jgi:gamma-glutamyl:cysteine ligase YbdK (ATP-grasp superfamily)
MQLAGSGHLDIVEELHETIRPKPDGTIEVTEERRTIEVEVPAPSA